MRCGLTAAVLLFGIGTLPAQADTREKSATSTAAIAPLPPAPEGATPIAVEIFASQACPACPPAAQLLKVLDAHKDIVALNWHVKYWNRMPSPQHGVWEDPFAHDLSDTRQRAYNKRFMKRKTVFTPQFVIDGAYSVRGTQEARINKRIIRVREDKRGPAKKYVPLSLTRDNGRIIAKTTSVSSPYDLVLLNLMPAAVTPITSGANSGRIYDEINIVRDMSIIAQDQMKAGTFTIDIPQGNACAILMQQPGHGRIMAARYCNDR